MALTNPDALVTERDLANYYQGILPYLGDEPSNWSSITLTNPNNVVTEQRLSEFYQGIFPYLMSRRSYKPTIYGMRILSNESVPSSKVVYLEDAVGMTPAYMDYTNGTFNYGDWGDAFFMPRPCMLKYDGTVDYYLDPNDYSKKEDGTASDIANTSYEGNAMMEWGQNGKKIWIKIVPDSTKNNKEADIYISDLNADGSYHDWSFRNAEGTPINHFYTPIYNGSKVNDQLRSLSGRKVWWDTGSNFISLADANNKTSKKMWTLETLADTQLINFLLILMGKTTDLQTPFGKGWCNEGGTQKVTYLYSTGNGRNDKGLFFGTSYGWPSGETAHTGVCVTKVFGMENWWGTTCRTYVGEVMVNGVRKIKMTYGPDDGSTTTGYNVTGDGYITTDLSAPTGSNRYVSEMIFNEYGMYPATMGGSSSTYYSDIVDYDNTITAIPMRGGFANFGEGPIGPFCNSLMHANTYSGWNDSWSRNACLACKPIS